MSLTVIDGLLHVQSGHMPRTLELMKAIGLEIYYIVSFIY